jgi:cytochrome P450
VREAPELRAAEVVRDTLEMRKDALAPFVRRTRTHGDVWHARIPGLHMYVVWRPEHVEHVLVTNQDNYYKGREHDLIRVALGDGLLTSEGELWRRQRRLVQPLFAKRHIEPFADQMTAAAARMLEEWDATYGDGEEIDVAEAMMALTLDVVGRALFGADLTGETRRTIGNAMTQLLSELLAAGVSPVTHAARSLPGVTFERALRLRPLRRRRLRARLGELDAVVAQLIEAHRNGRAHDGDDLLSLLLGVRDEETGEAMSDSQVRDEVVTFMLAGHETTANTLTWMWRLLSLSPAAREELHAEVGEQLDGRVPVFEDADRLPWTRAVVQETLRLYPPAWNVLRHVREEDVIGGFRIPADSVVLVLIYMTHRDPEVWPNPEGFDPSRFLPDQTRARPRHAYIPFVAGRRVCVGNAFALTEATLLTAMIAQRFVLDLDPTVRVEPEALLTLRPRGGLPMRIRRR